MVGAAGMGPQSLETDGLAFADETPEQTRTRVMKRFEGIGLTLMNRTRGSADFHQDPIASVLADPYKRKVAAEILGQAYVTAENFIAANRAPVERIAEALIEHQELYGDELVRLLTEQEFTEPKVDLAEETTWPRM
jgi:hypothetical protein